MCPDKFLSFSLHVRNDPLRWKLAIWDVNMISKTLYIDQ